MGDEHVLATLQPCAYVREQLDFHLVNSVEISYFMGELSYLPFMEDATWFATKCSKHTYVGRLGGFVGDAPTLDLNSVLISGL